MDSNLLYLFICLSLLSCNDSKTKNLSIEESTKINPASTERSITNDSSLKKSLQAVPTKLPSKDPNSLQSRIPTPKGFVRTKIDPSSFGHYLRNVKLKPKGSKVLYYDGTIKESEGVYMAVLDIDIGKEDLHQCADAIIKLKADYHYYAKEYDKIHFNFTNGHRVDYSEWRKGRRIIVDGNKTKWHNGARPSTSYEAYWKYLEQIFMYAGTASLSKELKPVKMKDMQIGDVLIKGGFPGHGVIVMDMAYHPTTGEKLYLLAQSYMPAQQTQILINDGDPDLSPWYRLGDYPVVVTPEYQFDNTDLMRFDD